MEKQSKPSGKAKKLLLKSKKSELMTKSKEALIRDYLDLKVEYDKLYDRYSVEYDRADKFKRALDHLSSKESSEDKYAGFDKSSTWTDKLVYIISRNPPSMSFKQIVGAVLELEPEIQERWTAVSNYISQTLYLACKAQAIVKKKKYGAGGQFYYTLPDY